MGRIALITGASSGIGKATAEKFIKEGWSVYGLARTREELEKVDGLTPLVADMTDEKSLEEAVSKVIDEAGKIDVLVNNAGYGLYGTVEDVPMKAAKHQFEVNIFGLARITQLALPHMREHKSGMIINISSMGGQTYTPLGAWYHATKYALEGWSDCLRLELKDHGLQVVLIEPGAIKSAWGKTATDNLLKYSGKGPHAGFAKAASEATLKTYEDQDSLTPASEVAASVFRAATSKNPKHRYVVGKYARPLIYSRKFLGTRVYDWLIMKSINRHR